MGKTGLTSYCTKICIIGIWTIYGQECVCLYWFHPLVWIAAKLSRQDAEYAADEAVTKSMGQEKRQRHPLIREKQGLSAVAVSVEAVSAKAMT